MNVNKKIKTIVNWLRDYKNNTNCKGVVLGLSGGKDSTTVSMLATKVWGNNVYAVLMPNGTQTDIQDSIDIAKQLDLQYTIINIDKIYNALKEQVKDGITQEVSAKSLTNVAPRIRMTVLYAIAQTMGYRVIGTGNKSEAFVGWTTKFGDSACDLNPIGHLTKTEVVEIGKALAKEFGLDEKFITKTPGDGLTGKTDEDNLGFTYELLDKYINKKLSSRIIKKNQEQIKKIEQLNKLSEHKRRMPYFVEEK